MRRVHVVIFAFLCTFLLTGCIKFDVALEINKDATVSGSMIFAISDSLAGLDDGNSNEDNLVEQSINTEAEGVTTSEYKEGGFTGTKYTFDRVPFEEFNKSGAGDEDSLKLIRDGNRLTVKGILDFSSEETSQDTEEFALGEDFAESLLSGIDLNISIKFPVRVLESTGTISEDGRTVTWKPKWGEKVDLTTTVEIPSNSPVVIIISILGLLAVLISLFFVYKKSRKTKRK
jgi:hypothetical protein